jgi:hypothetical protein
MAANLSLSDVKTIARRANFSALNLPIQQFFRWVIRGGMGGGGARESSGALCAHLGQPLTPTHFPHLFSSSTPSSPHYRSAVDKGVEAMNPSIYVRASTTFTSLVLTLSATRIHQLYFVDDRLHPVGCVRIGDLLRILVDEGPSM